MHDWLIDRQYNSFKIILHINEATIKLHFNVATKNFDHLLKILAGIKVNLDFITFSEAWLDAGNIYFFRRIHSFCYYR